MSKRTALILQLCGKTIKENVNPFSSAIVKPYVASCGKTDYNDCNVIRDIIDKIIDHVEKKCPFNYYDIEDSDSSNNDPDYVPSADEVGSENEIQNIHDQPALPSEDEVGVENDIQNLNCQPAKRRRKMTRKIKKGRKRIRDKNEWVDRKAKRQLNLGNEHENRKGKAIAARNMKPMCKENCRQRCRENISEENRSIIFHNFWKLGDHTRQWDYVARCVQQMDKKQVIKKNDSRRNFSREYKFFVNNSEVKCCKTMFLNTLGISETWVTTALKKLTESGSLEGDRRGLHTVRPHKIADNIKDSVRMHIKLFPVMPSHYIRKNSSKLYLEEGLNITKMYRLYKEYVRNTSASDHHFATERQYREILNSEFNIGFFKPKKDQCLLCTVYKDADMDAKSSIQEKYSKHLANKETARSLKDKDKDSAIDDKTICSACFDLQKILVTPQSEVSSFFYKSKIATYNFTVYDMGNNEGYCYVWHEEVAKRGPNEIGSCVLEFLKKQKDKDVRTINLYSDNCGGQNRNRFIFAMFAYAANVLELKITHRFLEKGHTQNEGDSMHAVIENAKKRQSAIYTPGQWITLIRMAKVTGKPYNVKEMSQADFFSFSNMVRNQNWKTDENGEQVKISKIRELSWSHDSPYVVFFKYEFEEDPRVLNLKKARRSQLQLCREPLPRLYNDLLPIDAKKLKGLLELCGGNEPAIPPVYHNFYFSLKSKEVSVYKKVKTLVMEEEDTDVSNSDSE